MMNRNAVMDRYYLDCRCMLLDLAAAFDRYELAEPAPGRADTADERLSLLRQATEILLQPSTQPDRTERILKLLSKPVA